MLINNKLVCFIILFVCFNPLAQAVETENQTKYNKAQNLIDESHGDTNQLKKALKLFQAIAESNPNSKYVLVGYGRLTYKTGYINYSNYDQAFLEQSNDYFEKAITISPSFFDAYYYGAYPYLFSKDYEKAKQMVNQAQKLSPESAKVDILLGQISKKENNYNAVVKYASLALGKSSDNKILTDAHSLLSGAYKKQNKYALAENSYQTIIEIEPNSAWARINYSGFLRKYIKNYDKATEQGKLALELMDFGMGHKVLGDAYYAKAAQLHWKKKEYDKSKKYFLLAIDKNPSKANAYYGLGMSYYRVGHKNKDKDQIIQAEKALEKAIKINPEHKQAIEQLDNVKNLLRVLNK